MKLKTAVIMVASAAFAISCNEAGYLADNLGVKVTPEENREYSYTDKKAGYWYGTTHQEQPEWWSGWNMAKKRILADYTIGITD
mgnify:FL=1